MRDVKVIVCGGRDYLDWDFVFAALDNVHAELNIVRLAHGKARGADALAGEWAISRGVEVQTYAANWRKYGNAAGPVRNVTMLRAEMPDLVIAFPGGSGTSNMVMRAMAAGVPVKEAPKHYRNINPDRKV